MFFAAKWKGEAKDFEKVQSYGCSQKLFFIPGRSEKNTVVMVHVIKTIEFKYHISATALIQSTSKDVNSVIN